MLAKTAFDLKGCWSAQEGSRRGLPGGPGIQDAEEWTEQGDGGECVQGVDFLGVWE